MTETNAEKAIEELKAYEVGPSINQSIITHFQHLLGVSKDLLDVVFPGLPILG